MRQRGWNLELRLLIGEFVPPAGPGKLSCREREGAYPNPTKFESLDWSSSPVYYSQLFSQQLKWKRVWVVKLFFLLTVQLLVGCGCWNFGPWPPDPRSAVSDNSRPSYHMRDRQTDRGYLPLGRFVWSCGILKLFYLVLPIMYLATLHNVWSQRKIIQLQIYFEAWILWQTDR